MIIGVPKEIKISENRVGLTEAGVKQLVAEGHQLFVQKDAGMGSMISNDDYIRAGAKILNTAEEIYQKAEMIIKKLGSNPTLESAAAAYNKSIQQAGADSTLTMSSQIINGLGVEAKVIGASFNKDYQTKVSPAIAGTSGVYLIKVNSIQAKPADAPEVAAQQVSSKVNTMRGSIGNWYEGLKKQASIKDNRSEFY